MSAEHTGNQQHHVIRQHLESCRLVGQLPKAAIDALTASARIQHFKVPTRLNVANEPLEHLRLVLDGHIEILERTLSGEEASIAMLGPRNWVTWLGCFDDRPSHYDFYSSANCTAIAIPCPQVRQIADQFPLLYRLVIGAIGDRFRLLMEWTTSSALLEQERRIAKLLYMISRLNTDLAPSPTIHYTQDKLAVLARCTRQTMSLALKKLEQLGLIALKYKRIEIVEPERLKAFAEDSQPS